MSFLIGLVLGIAVGGLVTFGVMQAKLRGEREHMSWAEERIEQLTNTCSVQARRINDMIRNPTVAVRANERIRKFTAKRRFRDPKDEQ